VTAQEIERLAMVEQKLDDMESRLDRQFGDIGQRLNSFEVKLDAVLKGKADADHVKELASALEETRRAQRAAMWWAISILATTGIGTIVYVIQGHIHFG
jgi:hypothetical protein